ncbi:putative elongator complex protein 4 [Aphelenchoides besseyi]|nr:putative elongator complex protein 4 [Aphelenchoides besseyi]KAI6232013.1 putative elongator complex protein 4 [Aphelenchoides besseyi]
MELSKLLFSFVAFYFGSPDFDENHNLRSNLIIAMIRIGDVARLPGTRIQNRCAVTSTGLDAIDNLLGGGLPIPSLYVISETNSKRFASFFQRYFLSEGVVAKHELLIHSPSTSTNISDLIENLPSCSTTSTNENESTNVPDAEMRIAWRYKTMPTMNSSLSAKDKTKFDLTNPMDVSENTIRTLSTTSYKSLWTHLYRLSKEEQFATQKGKNILRLLLTDFGSPFYEDPENFRPFLFQLRSLLQTANLIVMLTVDESILTTDDSTALLSSSDAYFRLEIPDAETKKNMGLEERYDGRFHVRKLPLLNSISTNKPDCVDLVFEKHRRYIEIRILHLPAVMGGAAEEAAKTPCQRILDQF